MVLHHFCMFCTKKSRLYRDIILIVSHNIMWHEFLLLLSLSFTRLYGATLDCWYWNKAKNEMDKRQKKGGNTWLLVEFGAFLTLCCKEIILFLLCRLSPPLPPRNTHTQTLFIRKLFSSLFIFQNVFVFRMLNERRRANTGVCLKWIGLTYTTLVVLLFRFPLFFPSLRHVFRLWYVRTTTYVREAQKGTICSHYSS